MQSKVNGMVTKKSDTKLSKSDENMLTNQVITVRKKTNHQEMTATTTYYRAEKHDNFKDNEIDAVQDWFEAEMEIDSELDTLDALDVNEKFFSFAQEQD